MNWLAILWNMPLTVMVLGLVLLVMSLFSWAIIINQYRCLKRMKKVLSGISNSLGEDQLYDLILHKEFKKKQSLHCNPLNKSKFYGFSQTDEDGITLEILNRISVKDGFFVEFGVGNGLENNTAILLAAGWKGAWYGGEELAFSLENSSKLTFTKVWIKRSNIVDLYKRASENADVVSLDLDGNDIYLVDELLSNDVRPKLFIVEYNGKFPPPTDFKIDYNDDHIWTSDDYQGASLASFNKLFVSHDYTLVCCNNSGANAFFVDNSFIDNFKDIPKDINELYCEPFYFLRKRRMHPTSPKTLELLVR
jgi:hypothetical protein